jgi:pyocin large subunit-like protein
MQNAKQYVEQTWDFLRSPPNGTLFKTRPSGELLRFHEETNIFGSYTKDGIPKTMFRPKDGIKYWETQ